MLYIDYYNVVTLWIYDGRIVDSQSTVQLVLLLVVVCRWLIHTYMVG